MEKEDIIRINLFIMRTFWDVYFGYVSNKEDDITDFYKTINMSSTTVSNIIGGAAHVKKGVADRLNEKMKLNRNVLEGEYLFTLGSAYKEVFHVYQNESMTEENGWEVYLTDTVEENKKQVRSALFEELKKQKSIGIMEDTELEKLLQYMRSVKNILKTVTENISKVSVSILNKCTPKELQEYATVLEQEYELVTAIQTIRSSSKMKRWNKEGEIKNN